MIVDIWCKYDLADIREFFHQPKLLMAHPFFIRKEASCKIFMNGILLLRVGSIPSMGTALNTGNVYPFVPLKSWWRYLKAKRKQKMDSLCEQHQQLLNTFLMHCSWKEFQTEILFIVENKEAAYWHRVQKEMHYEKKSLSCWHLYITYMFI